MLAEKAKMKKGEVKKKMFTKDNDSTFCCFKKR